VPQTAIASGAKQSRAIGSAPAALDCLVAALLAMTQLGALSESGGARASRAASLDAQSLPKVQMPNREGFIPDPRPEWFK